MLLHYCLPSPALREYVRLLQLIHFDFAASVAALPVKPYWPRPENCLAFYLRDPEAVAYSASSQLVAKPRVALIGQPTELTHRHVGRHCLVLQVVFQPGALYRLTGLPVQELTNTFVDAEAVFPREIGRVAERLGSASHYVEMTAIVEAFLLQLVQQRRHEMLPIDKVNQLLLDRTRLGQPAGLSVEQLASAACLSVKQYYRKSVERLGVGPKLFGRITRFDQAIKLHNAYPAPDWLSVALAAGYHDYQHLVRDFKDFTARTPTGFAQQENQAPERVFGLVET
jgi:AraC-like DNA-binding protein